MYANTNFGAVNPPIHIVEEKKAGLEPLGIKPFFQRNVGMLVLSRKKNESIVINDDITIVVVEIRGDKVRLGVEAPKEVPVHRREVYEAIKRSEQNDAVNSSNSEGSSAE